MQVRTWLGLLITLGLLLGGTWAAVARPAPPVAPQGDLTKPEGVDLDVGYISRSPRYQRYEVWYTPENTPYLRPGSEDNQRWPAPGETVTFTAHFVNKGTVASDPFDFVWRIDGADVLTGIHPGLAPGASDTANLAWEWAHTLEGERLLGEHTVAFVLDPENHITETYECNNVVEDRTDALSLVLALTPELYEALETPVRPEWPFSAEAWLQKQFAALNAAFAASIYPSAPEGALERVRLEEIIIASQPPPADFTVDGGFWMGNDDRYGNAYYHPETDVSGALLHELGHQLGLIDLYNLDVALEIPQVLDARGNPVQMEYYPRFQGLMSNAGIYPIRFAEHSVLALNSNRGYRRGYYGEYLYDLPLTTTVQLFDNEGQPAPGVTLRFYQKDSGPNVLGSRHGVIDNVPEITVTTGVDGLAVLPNFDVGEPITTNTGHTLRDNPFGLIDVVGRNAEFLVGLTHNDHEEYFWLDLTTFNLAAWRGETVLTFPTHVPPLGAPAGVLPQGQQARGRVYLTWEDNPDAVAYHVYQTREPTYAWRRVLTGTTTLEATLLYEGAQRAAGYAVTAVDALGRESGFAGLYWALRLRNPHDLLFLEGGTRLVLDPQNGYALYLQSETGDYFDTLGSFDLHLEYSRFLARDPLGRLLVSHPGDYYSSRHSLLVLDSEANLIFELGTTGTAPGQFNHPTGVAVWSPGGAAPGRILVADSGNDRLQAFTFDGDVVTVYHGDLLDPQGVAVLSDGTVAVADRGRARLYLLDFDGETFALHGELTADFVAPTHLTAHGPYLVVADPGQNVIQVLHRDGTLVGTHAGPDPADGGFFNAPHGVAVDAFGRVFVADTGQKRVVTLSGAVPPVPPAEVTLTGPGVGEGGVSYAFTATVAAPATLPLSYTWEAAAQPPVSRTLAAYSDTQAFTWPLTGTYALTVTVSNAGGSAVARRAILINPEFHGYLPLVLRGYPPGPHITAFYADVEIADPGQTIQLTWASYDATSATLYRLLPSGQYGSSWSVEPCGSMAHTIPETWRNFEHFILYVGDGEGGSDQAYLSIPLTCPDEWFFEPAPEGCPAGPALYSAGAEQAFEHGLMLWVGEEDRIYVLFDDGGMTKWRAYTDHWEEGDPIDDPSIIPPPGLYQPIRGFGLVWREMPEVRERLGWAIAPEQGYGTAVQRTSRWKYNDTYIRAFDGGTWRLGPEGSEWEYLPAP